MVNLRERLMDEWILHGKRLRFKFRFRRGKTTFYSLTYDEFLEFVFG